MRVESAPTSTAAVRSRALGRAAGALAACGVIALVDPHDGGYPVCPTRALLGVDCPVCGTLRGLHSLLHGDVQAALDHNVLLLVAVPVALLAWFGWVRTALDGVLRPSLPLALPRWTATAVITVAVAFAIVRNLPVEGLSWLSSSAGST